MNDSSASRIVFLILNEILPVATAKVSMWSAGDKYACPPMLRFRFKDVPPGSDFYLNMKGIVESFNGRLSWTISIRPGSINCLILPEIVSDHIEGVRFDVASFRAKLSNTGYRNIVDDAIYDVPRLAIFLRNNKARIRKGYQ